MARRDEPIAPDAEGLVVDLGSGLISYNGWTNTLVRSAGGVPLNGWEVLSADISPIGVTQYLDKKALQDGMDANDVYANARTISAIIGVHGSSKGRFWDNLQDVLSAFNPTLAFNADTTNLGFRELKFYQPTADIVTWPTSANPNGIPMQFFARPSALPRYTLDKKATTDEGRGLSTKVSVQLLCRDPRKYLQSRQSLTISTSSQTVDYRGDYPTFPIINVTISAAGSSVATFVVGDTTLIIDLSTETSATTYTIDFAQRSIVNTSGASKNNHIVSGTFLPIGGDVVYRMSNTTGISSASLLIREAFA
jgi:hypothetical protein